MEIRKHQQMTDSALICQFMGWVGGCWTLEDARYADGRLRRTERLGAVRETVRKDLRR